MLTIPVGWGGEAVAPGHYRKFYADNTELPRLVIQCIAAGLRNGEQVLYALHPRHLATTLHQLAAECPDLNQRIGRGQLMQCWLGAQCYHAWQHGGRRAVHDLLTAHVSEAAARGFRLVRSVGDASLALAETNPLQWSAVERVVGALLQPAGGPSLPLTMFSLYRAGAHDEPMAVADRRPGLPKEARPQTTEQGG